LRKFNVIIYGLTEQLPDGAESREVMMEKDKNTLDNLLTKMNQDPAFVNDSIKYRRRLGKREVGKVRPLLISFSDIDCRNSVLASATVLEGPIAKKIRIRPDLTQMQREDDSKIIKEVSDLNEEEPQDELGDYRWRVVGPPGMLRKAKTRDLNKWKVSEELRKAKRVVPNPKKTPAVANNANTKEPVILSTVAEEDEEEETPEDKSNE
jgi:hypothetical protein